MLATIFLTCCLIAPSGALYDTNGQREGSVKATSPGRFEILDRYSHRVGSGRQASPDAPIEVFDRYGQRIYNVRPSPPPAPRPGARR